MMLIYSSSIFIEILFDLSFLMVTITKKFGIAISQYIKKETFKAEID